MRDFIELFLIFAKIGVSTFGGGYAMVPMLLRELTERRDWATQEELLDGVAIGQTTPGIIAVNIATLVGFKRRGVAGGIIATLGMIAPSFAIILIVAAVLSNFAEYPAVKHAFAGIRVCVVALIATTVARLWRSSVADRPALAIFAPVFLLATFTGVPLIALIALSGAAGVVIAAVRRGRGR
jgi:chromate transporter